MSGVATRRLRIRHARALRTQARPSGEEDGSAPKRSPGFKSRAIREILRHPEPELDAAAAQQQAVRPILEVRELLARHPGGLLDMAELSTRRPSLADAVLEQPAIFSVLRYSARSRLVCFTPEAQAVFLQEAGLREETEARSVLAVRKLVMLSRDRRLDLGKLGLVAVDLGLVPGFADLVRRRGELFRVDTMLDRSTWVRVAAWDPELAVSFAEVGARRAGTMSELEMWAPKGQLRSKRHRKVMARYREAPWVSPYADARELEPLRMKLERHAVAGLQELLSLTVHKSLPLGALAAFPTDFSFSHRPLHLALRHPALFYVSPVGMQDTVLLRSAYRGARLAHRSPLVLIRERLAQLLLPPTP